MGFITGMWTTCLLVMLYTHFNNGDAVFGLVLTGLLFTIITLIFKVEKIL